MKRRSTLLGLLLVALVVGPCLPLVLSSSEVPLSTRLAAYIFWLLALLPSWSYLQARAADRPPIPFLPIVGLLYGSYYALPLTLGVSQLHWSIRVDPRTDYDSAIVVALLGWCCLLIGHVLFQRPFGKPTKARGLIAGEVRLISWGVTLAVLGIGIDVIRRLVTLPESIRSAAQFAETMSWFGIGVLIVLALKKQLKLGGKIALVGVVTGNLLLQLTTGLVSNTAIYLMVLFLCYWVAARTLSRAMIVAGVAALLPLAALRGLMADYRHTTWYGGATYTPIQSGGILYELAGEKLDQEGLLALVSGGGEAAAARSSNLDLLADVMRRTPDDVPYWNGESYRSLIGIAIPRALWPDKPSKDLGQQFGHRYSYLMRNDVRTSFNLPQLVECYANFGLAGVVIGMFLIGVLYALVERHVNQPGQSVITSIAGVALLVPLFNVESDFSLVFGSLVLNGLGLRLLLALAQRRDRRELRSQSQAKMWAAGAGGGGSAARG